MIDQKLARKLPQKIKEYQISRENREENRLHSRMWLWYLIFQNPVKNVFLRFIPLLHLHFLLQVKFCIYYFSIFLLTVTVFLFV